jgi:hypothetical protein
VGKVIKEESRGEVSLMEKDTIENVSKLIKLKKKKIKKEKKKNLTSFYATS